MNCGMEDCLVLDEILTKHLGPTSSPNVRPNAAAISAALEEYTATRNPDVEAMVDLAMYNYGEMRSSVTKAGYLFRKTVEGWLHRIMPQTIIPLYTMVSFTRIRYSEAMRRWERQTRWFDMMRRAGEVAIVFAVVGAGLYFGNRCRLLKRLPLLNK